MVRFLWPKHYPAPWPFVKKGSTGQRKYGPHYYEKPLWPGNNREFPELNPKLFKLNPRKLHNYTHVNPTGYLDPVSGNFVKVKEMIPEMIVPDLNGFELKPYVSYRTDVEIEKRRETYESALAKYGSEEEADKHTEDWGRWPPPKMTSKTLFDLFYKQRIREEFKKKKSDNN